MKASRNSHSRSNRHGASWSGKASLSSSWVDDQPPDSVMAIGKTGSHVSTSTNASPPKDSPLASEVRKLNLATTVAALARCNGVFAPGGPSMVDDEQILAFWADLKNARLGYAEIVESLVEVARLCLKLDCTPRGLAMHPKPAPANDSLGLDASNDVGVGADADVAGHVRWVLLWGRLTLDKLTASLPLAHAGGVPGHQLREKQAMVDEQAARIAALEMWCALTQGDAQFEENADAIAVLVSLSIRHTDGDFGRLHAAFGQLIRFCEDLETRELHEASMTILEEAEVTLARDVAWLAARLADAPTSMAPPADLVDALLARLPVRPLCYWRYCCGEHWERWVVSRRQVLEDSQRRLRNSRDHLRGDLCRRRRSHLAPGRTRQVLDVARTVKALSVCVGQADRTEEADQLVQRLRALLVDMRKSDKASQRQDDVVRRWMERLVGAGCLASGSHVGAKALRRVRAQLAKQPVVLDELVAALVASEQARLEAKQAEVSGELKALACGDGPMQRLRFALLVRSWEASLPPTSRPYGSDRPGFWGTAAYAFFRDGACTYLARLAMDSLAEAVRDFAHHDAAVPEEAFDWLAFAVGGGLTLYSLYRMHSLRQAPELGHTPSKFARLLAWSSGLLVAVQCAGGLGVTIAHRVMDSGAAGQAYRLWSAAVWSSFAVETSRGLRQVFQSPLTLKAPGIPGLGPRIKTIELQRLDGRLMPPEHAIKFHSIRDLGYAGLTTFLGGGMGQFDLQTLAFGLSRIGLAAGEAGDAMWADIAKLYFASLYPHEYRVVVKEMSAASWAATMGEVVTQAAGRSAFGGAVAIWANFAAVMYELYAQSHPNAMRLLPIVGGFLLGATTGPRSRLISDLQSTSSGYVVPSGLMPSMCEAVKSCIPLLRARQDAHRQKKIQQRVLLLDQAIGRAADQTAERFRRWVDDLVGQIVAMDAGARPDFKAVLQQHWKAESNPLAHLSDPGAVRGLLQAWLQEATNDAKRVALAQPMASLLETAHDPQDSAALASLGTVPIV